ncbi:hypothetical protein BHE74_00046193, partial [Ensete ventricosum]
GGRYDDDGDDDDVDDDGGGNDDDKRSDRGITIGMPRIVALIPIDRTLNDSIDALIPNDRTLVFYRCANVCLPKLASTPCCQTCDITFPSFASSSTVISAILLLYYDFSRLPPPRPDPLPEPPPPLWLPLLGLEIVCYTEPMSRAPRSALSLVTACHTTDAGLRASAATLPDQHIRPPPVQLLLFPLHYQTQLAEPAASNTSDATSPPPPLQRLLC